MNSLKMDFPNLLIRHLKMIAWQWWYCGTKIDFSLLLIFWVVTLVVMFISWGLFVLQECIQNGWLWKVFWTWFICNLCVVLEKWIAWCYLTLEEEYVKVSIVSAWNRWDLFLVKIVLLVKQGQQYFGDF